MSRTSIVKQTADALLRSAVIRDIARPSAVPGVFFSPIQIVAPSTFPTRNIASSLPLFQPSAASSEESIENSASASSSALTSEPLKTSPLPVDVCVPPRRRRRNLADIVWRHAAWGEGVAVAKRHWHPGTFYRISRVHMSKVHVVGYPEAKGELQEVQSQ